MKHLIKFKVNGVEHELLVSPNQTLVQVLHEQLHLTGAREACGVGVCGACTVLVDGLPASSCSMLAVFADGKSLETVEGLAKGEELHVLQEEFWVRGASQCAYCTPGFILSSKSLLAEMPEATEDELLEWLSGNICRCTGYVKIIEAVKAARERLQTGKPAEGA